MKTTVSEKGQITIPKPLRLRLGLGKGQVLDVREERGRLIIIKTTSANPFDKYYGTLKTGKTTDEIMAELRGEEYLRGYRR